MKDTAIRLYLQGTSRDEIARTLGLGKDTVSNIIDEWSINSVFTMLKL
jgi:transposase